MNNQYITIALTGASYFIIGGILTAFTNDLIEVKLTKKNFKRPLEYNLHDFVNYGSYLGLSICLYKNFPLKKEKS